MQAIWRATETAHGEYARAMYHVINRGDRREDIIWDEQDREMFLWTLTESCLKTEWQAHAADQ